MGAFASRPLLRYPAEMSNDAPNWTDVATGGHVCRVHLLPSDVAHRYTMVYLHRLDPKELQQAWLPAAWQRHGVAAVCPVTGPSWWSDRICDPFDQQITAERYVLEHALPLARQIAAEAGAPRVGLLGIGMGGQGALRIAYKHPDIFGVVAAIAPAIDYQQRIDEGDRVLAAMYRDAEEARQDTATLHIHPLNWPRHQWFCSAPDDWQWYDSAERLRMKLYSLGVPHECDLETTADGASDVYVQTMIDPALEFITSRIDQF